MFYTIFYKNEMHLFMILHKIVGQYFYINAFIKSFTPMLKLRKTKKILFSLKNRKRVFYKKLHKKLCKTFLSNHTRRFYLITKRSPFILENFNHINPSQKNVLFIKRKFGLYKTRDFNYNRSKQKLLFLLNFLKKRIAKKSNFKKSAPILFYKKLKKLFFRAGRRIIMSHFNVKKQLTQKFITKYLGSFIRRPWTPTLFGTTLAHILIKSNVFFSFFDSEKFIKQFGVVINRVRVYDPQHVMIPGDFFFLVWTKILFKFFKKKRLKTIKNLKQIKFYKFRSKLFFSKYKFNWIPSTEWLAEHSFIYIPRLSNVEFDYKSLIGCYLYELDYINNVNAYNITTLSLFMVRSYNWKYIT